jgi:hypothetical protein
MDDLDDFRTFYELADRLIADASKDDVAEAARLLALNVAHYQLKYGALPIDDFADMLRAHAVVSRIIPPPNFQAVSERIRSELPH